jgi:plasmid stabilization system protein ParE
VASAVRFLEEAQADAWAAEAWYRARSPEAARRFVAALRQAVARIAEGPTRWRADKRNTRRYVLQRFPFSLVYRLDDMGVCVVAVAHAKRAPGYWRRR